MDKREHKNDWKIPASGTNFLIELKGHFWRDKNGKIVLWQSPNSLIITWATLSLLRYFLHAGNFKTYIGYAATVSLFLWAIWELTQGVNYFRRLLGLAVLLMIIAPWFS